MKLSANQPPLGAHTVCAVPPRTRAFAVTRDSRNRLRRKRKVRSPHPLEEDRRNLHLKLGTTVRRQGRRLPSPAALRSPTTTTPSAIAKAKLAS
jgi:hypothetical protein